MKFSDFTGEHGIGSLKIAYLDEMVGTAEHAPFARGAAFVPHLILNPGRSIAAR